MPLRLPDSPQRGFDEVRSNLLDLVDRPDSPQRMLASASAETLSLTAPHQVYTMTLEDLVAGRGLEAVSVSSWRYLVMDGDQAIATAEVGSDAKGRAGAFTHVNQGPFVESTARAIAAAERRPSIRNGAFELRVLRVPGLSVMALWLKSEDGGEDEFVPLGEGGPSLKAGRRYTTDDFLNALRPAAGIALEGGDA